MALADRLKSAWNAFAFAEQSPQQQAGYSAGPSTSVRPDRPRLSFYSERSIVSAIYARMSIDFAGIEYRHVEVDSEGRYKQDKVSMLNYALSLEANVDQAPRQFRQDIAMTLFDNGAVALVPVDTSESPIGDGRFDVHTLRVGIIVAWFPRHVKVRLYNIEKGVREDIVLEKKFCAIIENPLLSVMNEPNSTLQRLIRKLALLDQVDEVSSSGKLDLIIQLPYTIRSDARREQAEQRRQDIEFQLKGSQHGIAYADATEKITQLNRPVENTLLKQVEYLTNLLYNQLGITEGIMNGTADEAAMLNYFNRTIEPLLDATVEAMQRSFLGVMGIKNNERILYFRDPFKLVPVNELADIADKFTRNEILTSNEFRQIIGRKPSSDPRADELINKNMPAQAETQDKPAEPPEQQTDDS